jgi:hypothetical protein
VILSSKFELYSRYFASISNFSHHLLPVIHFYEYAEKLHIMYGYLMRWLLFSRWHIKHNKWKSFIVNCSTTWVIIQYRRTGTGIRFTVVPLLKVFLKNKNFTFALIFRNFRLFLSLTLIFRHLRVSLVIFALFNFLLLLFIFFFACILANRFFTKRSEKNFSLFRFPKFCKCCETFRFMQKLRDTLLCRFRYPTATESISNSRSFLLL